MDAISKLRNPFIVALIPIIGLFIILAIFFSNLLAPYPQLTLLGFVLEGYILYWASVSSTQLKRYNEKINEDAPTLIFVLFIIGNLFAIILGYYIAKYTQSTFLSYSPIFILTFLLYIWLVLCFYRISEGLNVMSRRKFNPTLNLIFLIIFPPLGMAYSQSYINRNIKGEFELSNPVEEVVDKNKNPYLK